MKDPWEGTLKRMDKVEVETRKVLKEIRDEGIDSLSAFRWHCIRDTARHFLTCFSFVVAFYFLCEAVVFLARKMQG